MKLLGNICWIILGGLECGLAWLIAGLLWCISIVGIPFGLQCFKFAATACWPFGKKIVYGGRAASVIANIIWVPTFGLVLGLAHAFFGLLWCITIVGIPFGLQFFKLAKLSILPFGARIEK